MTPAQLTYLKFGTAAFVVLCGTLLSMAHQLDAGVLFSGSTSVVAGLLVALGITGAGNAVAVGQQASARTAALEADKLRGHVPGAPVSPS